MKILYIVTGTDKPTVEFTGSLENLSGSYALGFRKKDDDEFIFAEEEQLYFKLKDKVNEEFDYVCLIPVNSEINPNYKTFIKEYKEEDENTIYLPLVVLTSTKTKGVLNNCVWSSNLAVEPGVLDHELAVKQVDTTLYGALIPAKAFFDEALYNTELKHYQHFHFLNAFTKDEKNLVIGIPKTLLFTDIDLSLSNVPNDEKLKHFKLSKAAYAS